MRSLLPATFDVMRDFAHAHSVADVHKTLLRHAAPYGAVNIMAAIIPDRIIKPSEQHNYLVFGHWPVAWVARYFEKQYVRRDPTIFHSATQYSPLWWADIHLPVGHPGRTMMDEGREFLLKDGLTIPQITVDGQRIALSFSGEHLDNSARTTTILTVLASYAVARALQIRSISDTGTVHLTTRERECLAWVAEGKTTEAVGDILGVSAKMVEKHLAQAREKLASLTTVQAVATAIRLGLF